MSTFHKWLVFTILIVVGAAVVLSQGRTGGRIAVAGGLRVVLQANPDDLKDAKGQHLSPEQQAEKMNAAIKTIRARIEGNFGVAEPQVSRQGDDRVLVELPGVKDKKKAIELIKDTAKLEIYYLRDVVSDRNPSALWRMMDPQTDEKTGLDIYAFENVATKENIKSDTLEGQQKILDKVIDAWDPKTNPNGQRPIITGNDLKPNAQGDFENGTQAVIRFEMNDNGTQKFRDFTTRHIGELTVVLLGNRILTAPRVQNPITDGKAVITGFVSLKEAQEKAQLLNSGALPVGFKVVQIDDIKATTR